MHQYKADANGIQLIQMENRYPDLEVYTDEQRVMQVLHNLLTNALKFTLEGTVTVKWNINRVEDNEFLTISVSDTGVGIKQQDQSKLFKLFGFIQSTQEMNTKGIGLGLMICDKIVKKFGGQITLESEFNVGSEFTFSFQLTRPEDVKEKKNEVKEGFQLNSEKLFYEWKPQHDITIEYIAKSGPKELPRSLSKAEQTTRNPKILIVDD